MSKKKKKILMIYTEWGSNQFRLDNSTYGGIGYYRIIKPALYLKEFYDVTVVGKDISKYGIDGVNAWNNIFQEFDLVITKHTDNESAAAALLAMAEHNKKPVLVDMDDNFLSIRADNPAAYAYAKGERERYTLSALLSLATGLIVSTENLKTAYQHINPNIDVAHNYNDVKDWNFLVGKHTDGKIRIGYAGSVTHSDDFALITPALKHVLQKYPLVELEILGAFDKKKITQVKKTFRSVKGKVNAYNGTPAWIGYGDRLAQMGWDIGIAPLVDEPFNRCKSHIKFMEYSMFQYPTIASNVTPYKEVIKHNKTGLLCSTTQDWVIALERLIESPSSREFLGKNAYDSVKDTMQYSQHILEWKTIIDKYI